jgi:hypothetical protein
MANTPLALSNEDRLAALQQKGGLPDASSSPNGAASQEGALGAPPQGGVSSDATAFGPRSGADALGNKPREEGKTGMRYLDMWKTAGPEDKKAQLDALEEQLGGAGTGVKAKANEFIGQAMKSGNEAVLKLAMEYGWAPRDGQVGPTKEPQAALADMEERKSDPKRLKKEQRAEIVDAKRKRGEWTREDMGGFLTELGFRILASNRDDVGGALGESVQGMKKERQEKKRYDESQSIAKAERERKRKREDRADTLKEEKARREVTKEEREKLEKIVQKDGTVEYVDIKKGKVVGEDGEELRVATDSDLSKAQQQTNERAIASARAAAGREFNKLASDRTDPEVKAIQKIKDPDKRKAAKQKWIEDKVESQGRPGYERPGSIEDW